MLSRRDFVVWSVVAGAWVYVGGATGCRKVSPGGNRPDKTSKPLDPASIDKYSSALLIPPVMPRAAELEGTDGKPVDYYEISVKQFSQQVLPESLPATTVWGYGAVSAMEADAPLLHNAPSLTIEARTGRATRVKWINNLVDEDGNYLPHLLPVDPTLHWANPGGGEKGRDTRPRFDETPEAYDGPVPIVIHVHGAVGVGDESDGYPEAWYLPDASDLPEGFSARGTWYDFFSEKAASAHGVSWGPGYSVYQYPNLNRACTLWYHDHALGMTRLNVYTGPAGFFILRGGPAGDEAVKDKRTGGRAKLPGPAPQAGDDSKDPSTYREIAVAIQDRAFNEDGSLFYPDSRDFFDEVTKPYLPEKMGFSPIWNPEYFGNAIIANGKTWPYQTVEQQRYRFRFLNGCQSRFLILDFSKIPQAKVHQIGNEGGFLAAPFDIGAAGNRLLMAPAERADVVLDFTAVPPGEYVLGNVAPDEPFGGGDPGTDFEAADPATTGQVMQFRVVAATGPDASTPAEQLVLPAISPLPSESVVRKVALIEKMGMGEGADGEEIEGPLEAELGIVDTEGEAVALSWIEAVSENPEPGATEVWELYNTTGDAHPIHIHEVTFEVVGRQGLKLEESGDPVRPLTPTGPVSRAEPWETGRKDTVIAYPGQVTRIRASFANEGQFVWHCHILEHEDNEMMRPYRIGPEQTGQPPQRSASEHMGE